jgi:monoamine oxidase
MARTPLASMLQEMTRRELLARGGAAAAGAALATTTPRWLPAANAATGPRIVVVGGGLAGLTAAYRLQQAGYSAQLHEGNTRLGGRCWTIRGAFSDGQVAEHGGELIDTNHTAIRQLAQELRLNLVNLHQAEQNGTEPSNWFNGSEYTYAEATDDLKGIWQQIHSDVSAASYPTTYQSSTQRGRELDAMSIAKWIDTYVPGGRSSNLGKLLDVAYNIEYGAETTDQSSLNMLYLLGYAGQGQLRIFGQSNEKFHVAGGNDLIVDGLVKALGSQITTGSTLVAVKRNTDGTFALSFQQGASTVSKTADKVVLALPFSMLRSVDYSKAGFSTVKKRAIAELPMGTNSKLNVGFKTRHWRSLGNNGDTFGDTGYQSTWEVSRGQAGTSGILVDYTGGKIGSSFGSGTPSSRAQQFCAQIEPLLPGITQKLSGKATIDHWPSNPWTKGSYSYWKPGQYTAFAGAEGEQSGNCHFAGEHTSQDFQGYLNGAVETGERAAAEILSDLK